MRMIADLLQCAPKSGGGGASLIAHIVPLYQCTHAPVHTRRILFPGLATRPSPDCLIIVCTSLPVPQYTLAASSSLAWPLVVSQFAHTILLYPQLRVRRVQSLHQQPVVGHGSPGPAGVVLRVRRREGGAATHIVYMTSPCTPPHCHCRPSFIESSAASN